MKKHKLLKPLIGIFVLIALLGCANTQAVKQSSQTIDAPVLTSVRIDESSLIIQSNTQFTYSLSKTNDPYRATLEIPDMSAGSVIDKIISDSGMVTEVIPQQIDSPRRMMRLDIVLQSPSSLSPEYRDNTLILSIKKDDPVVLSEAKNLEAEPMPLVRLVAVETPAEKEASPVSSRATEINSITIKKSADTVKVIISGNGTMIPNVFPVNERIVVDIPETALRAAIPTQTLSPLKGIRAGKHKDKLRIVLDLKEKTNFDVTAIGNTIEISLANKEDAQPQRAAQTAPAESAVAAAPAAAPSMAAQEIKAAAATPEGDFAGKKISLDFQDADIIPIFRLLGDVSGYNIVVNPEVKGKITLKLINVPWDQALDIIMRTFHLSKIVDGNIIRVLPTTAVAKELDEIKTNKKAQAEAGDLITKIIPVNYAELTKLRDAIDKAKLLSSRGSISLDERGSSIIINDLEVNIEKINALIKEIDIEHMQARQVMIEAKIVEVSSTYTKDLGIEWGAFFTKATGQGTSSVGNVSGIPLVNLPAVGPSGNIGFGFINRAGTLALDLKLSAMETLLKGKVISNPKIVTMNNEEATITQGSSIYLESTVAGATTPSFTEVKALLSLRVKPRIAPGGAIFMEVDITKDQPGPLVGTNVSVLKNTAKTSVLVKNEDTIVIGGIFKKSENLTDDSIPGLSKLPLFGKLLFNREQNTNETTEMLIFITPRILDINSLK
ncbi:MAG: type IV pilus secretin PilQ [Nitrospirae bacterium]|nr:type IV pilus secretin PilQ [Nitrospirota bacterium]